MLLPAKGDRDIIHEIKTESGEIVSDSKRIANTINKSVANIGKVLADKITPSRDFNPPETKPPENHLTMKLINVDFVKKELSSLDMTKSTGIDTIPSRLLKANDSTTYRALTHIFNRSITSANVNKEWTIARVTPIFKDGDRTEVGSYRPISILPVVMKILERETHNQLYSYLTENKLLSPAQSGFHKKYSTLTTLIDISHCILKDVEEGKGTGVLFLDLKKAFDTVNHSLLIKKLGIYGVGNSSLKWFKNYLSDREQTMEINGATSDWELIKAGVP